MRIFLSYGHDDYVSLASRIKRDLEAIGHKVWFDLQRLKPGGDWERYIEDGLDETSAVPDAGRFLLLMTPHSVRRPDGYCLNELARASKRNLSIIPVMVSSVEPPLSICRLQWLDMRNAFPVEQHEEQYAKRFEQLVKALTERQVPFEGVQQRLLNHLDPVRYGDDFQRHLLRFTGREWVMSEVEGWLASSRRVLWITGEAGVGKSALAAWLCNRRPEIAAYHFCRFGNSDRVDARKILFSLAYQLTTQIPIYQERLSASRLDKTILETNLPAIFDRLFIAPLSDAVPIVDRPQVLLIDALDEATRSGGNELASLIGAEFYRLPPWLRVIVTSRPYEQEVNFALQALDPWKLDAGRAENLDDIREFLQRELRPFTIKGAPSEPVVNAIIEKSEGLFLYVSWVRQGSFRP
ncbi:MAG: toll/interleukin-1 receptor domain-containing protein [Terriglobales bacterium]